MGAAPAADRGLKKRVIAGLNAAPPGDAAAPIIAGMDTLLLSRIQFAANIAFHILFPTINIALCWFLVYFRLRQSAAGGTAAGRGWEEAYYLWTKIFALSFALGVVSGITMSFQFGTNWPGYMERAGNIAGPLLG